MLGLVSKVSVIFGVLGLLAAPTEAAGPHVALVIGNSTYKNVARLPNAGNDANAIADLFRGAGFDVVEQRMDVGIAQLRRAVGDFAEIAREADIAVVYYAGHGIEVDGTNYLIPADAVLARDFDIEDETISLDRVLKAIEPARRLRLVILDACRDNPFTRTMKRTIATRAIGRGLAKVEPTTTDTLIAFAAKAGSTASDGDGPNSPYTAALLKHLVVPGLDIRFALGQVRDEVLETTKRAQEPFYYGSLGGRTIALKEAPVPVAEPGKGGEVVTAKDSDPASIEIAFWDTIKTSRNPRLFEAYLKRYPNGAFADLAKISLEEFRVSALNALRDQSDDKIAISDPGLIREAKERLYELNFDPGAFDGPPNEAMRQAIREFQAGTKLAQTGELTLGLLKRLREVGGLKPWGAIVYGKGSDKWGMSWGGASRQEAVANARSSCGSPKQCTIEISFFGTECGAFAHSGGVWAIVARDDIDRAKEAALGDCRKRGGKACRVIAATCADGAGRLSVSN